MFIEYSIFNCVRMFLYVIMVYYSCKYMYFVGMCEYVFILYLYVYGVQMQIK